MYRLFVEGHLPRGCAILGVSRDVGMTDEKFREIAREALAEAGEKDAAAVAAWTEKWLFFQGVDAGDGVDDDKEFADLRKRVEQIEHTLGLAGNRSFYLSLPPGAVPATVEMLGKSGLNAGPGWTRLVIEKPFGHDLPSAKTLNALVHQCFDESQIYRIDHY